MSLTLVKKCDSGWRTGDLEPARSSWQLQLCQVHHKQGAFLGLPIQWHDGRHAPELWLAAPWPRTSTHMVSRRELLVDGTNFIARQTPCQNEKRSLALILPSSRVRNGRRWNTLDFERLFSARRDEELVANVFATQFEFSFERRSLRPIQFAKVLSQKQTKVAINFPFKGVSSSHFDACVRRKNSFRPSCLQY